MNLRNVWTYKTVHKFSVIHEGGETLINADKIEEVDDFVWFLKDGKLVARIKNPTSILSVHDVMFLSE